jgi:hypothetical protein
MMDVSKAALIAIAVLGVNGAPFNGKWPMECPKTVDEALTWYTELKVRQNNDTANNASSEPEGHWSVFSPQTARPELTLIVPGALPTYTPAPSPVIAITQLSFEVPEPQETESTTQDATSQTIHPKPTIQPPEISLIVPVTDAVSEQTSIITVVPTARIESSATYIWIPGPDTTSPTRAPKMPHIEHTASEFIQPSKPTDAPDTHEEDDDWDYSSSGSDATTQWPTQIGVIVASGTGSTEGEKVTGPPTQHIPIPRVSGTTEISRGDGEAHATLIFGVDGTPLVAGGSPITVGGTTYSLASTGSAVLINGKPQATQIFVVNNTPLIAGGFPITVSGTTYSLGYTGSTVVVNDNTVSITTDSQGRLVPVETRTDSPTGDSTDSSTSEVLGDLSIVSAGATATAGSAPETGSAGAPQFPGAASASGAQGAASSTSASGTQVATSTTAASGGNAGATATATDGQAAVQSDSAGEQKLPTWPIAAMAGAIGLLAVVV